MKLLYYYNFETTGTFTGVQSDATNLYSESSITLTGGKYSPGNVLKMCAGDNAWVQDIQSVSFLNSALSVTTLSESDWTSDIKKEWVIALCKHVGCYKLVNNDVFLLELIAYFSTLNIFQLLSGAALAYVEQSEQTNEISIGLNMAQFPHLLNYAYITKDEEIKSLILSNHQEQTVYVSHLIKVDFLSKQKICYCFGGDIHPYIIQSSVRNLSPLQQLAKGGGNIFGEVKLAGDKRKENYLVKKDIDISDPTYGLYSGIDTNLSVGDNIYLVDNSTYTTRSLDDWTWFGDYNQINYTWFVADITYPKQDFPNTPVSHMNFPIEVIEEMQLNDFEIVKPVR